MSMTHEGIRAMVQHVHDTDPEPITHLGLLGVASATGAPREIMEEYVDRYVTPDPQGEQR